MLVSMKQFSTSLLVLGVFELDYIGLTGILSTDLMSTIAIIAELLYNARSIRYYLWFLSAY